MGVEEIKYGVSLQQNGFILAILRFCGVAKKKWEIAKKKGIKMEKVRIRRGGKKKKGKW